MDQRREIKRLIIVSSFAITVTITHQDTHLISKSLCCANYTRKIIHSFNLTNTFYDLLRHRYMSPDSHMKKGLNSYCWIRIPICYQLSHPCLSIIKFFKIWICIFFQVKPSTFAKNVLQLLKVG